MTERHGTIPLRRFVRTLRKRLLEDEPEGAGRLAVQSTPPQTGMCRQYSLSKLNMAITQQVCSRKAACAQQTLLAPPHMRCTARCVSAHLLNVGGRDMHLIKLI